MKFQRESQKLLALESVRSIASERDSSNLEKQEEAFEVSL